MASLPPRQQSQRRSSPEQSGQSQPQAPASPIRAHSEDSQTLFINSQPSEPKQDQDQNQQSAPPLAQPPTIDDDPKKCWICFADETEDTPETSPWRDPCPCALVAHEECLLDWIADQESPRNNRSRRSIGAPKIECPQCKSEIKLARPRNLVVDAVRALERIGAKAITPGALTFLSASLYQSSLAWGMHSIYAVFGPEDGFRILRPLILNTMRPPLEVYVGEPAQEVGKKVLGLVLDHLVHWRLYIGLPLITPVLILSRTKLADSILPVLPILFFATQTHDPRDTLDFTHWPPSAGMCFAVLPYVRAAYNLYYEKVWAEREKAWMKAIQPRQGQNTEDGANGAEGDDDAQVEELVAAGQEDNMFEVRIERGFWEEWEEDAAPRPRPAQQVRPPAAAPAPPQQQQEQEAQHDGPAQPPPNIPDHRAAAQPAQANRPAQQPPPAPAPAAAAGNGNGNNGERRLSFSPTTIAETILGAILFPTLAGLSGEVLKFLLPRSLTTPSSAGMERLAGGKMRLGRGILTEKWGRSLLGGCALVVLKDCVGLYVRWRMAGMHRERRVVDFDRRRGRGR